MSEGGGPKVLRDDGDGTVFAYDSALLGETEVGKLTCETLRALTRASRACLLYDSENESVWRFLSELEQRIVLLLVHGEVVLEVKPFEMLRSGELVYRETDREKSFAFRLYRDGVRRLKILPGVSWDEISRFVAIMSLRYTGIRQQEDDIVTLLWSGGFRHIQVVTVESYGWFDDEAESEQSSGVRGRRSRLQAALFDMPAAFDHTFPPIHGSADVRPVEVPATQLQQLAAEASEAATPLLCVQAAEHVVTALADPANSLPLDQCIPFLREIRDFLLGEKLTEHLLEMTRLIKTRAPAHALAPLMAILCERAPLAHLIDAAIAEEQTPSVLTEMIAMLPVSELTPLAEVLRDRWQGPGRSVGIEVASSALGSRLGEARELILSARGAMAADLLAMAAARNPNLAVELAVAMLGHNDPTAQLRAISVLRNAPYSADVGRALTRAVATSKEERLVTSAASLLAAHQEQRAFDTIAKALDRGIEGRMSVVGQSVLAEAMATLDSESTLELMTTWIQPGGILQRLRVTPGPAWWPGASALAAILDPRALEILEWMVERSEGELAGHCREAFERLQHAMADTGHEH
jgi:hypothetical protein